MKHFHLSFVVVLAVSASVALGATIHVPSDQPTIQAGIDSASTGDTVLVAPGVYTGPGNRDIDFGGRDIIVLSVNGPQATIIDCQANQFDSHRSFTFHSGETNAARVEGFTIQNGYALFGGAILCSEGSSPTIAGNVIVNNQDPSGGGGGICCDSSDPVLIGNVLSGNTADDGGAICLINSQATILYNVMAGNNTPNEGGALSLWNSKPLMESNTIVCNASGYGGGGMFLYNSSPTLLNCVVAFNRGIGGILCSASGTDNNPELFRCNIFGNENGDWVGCIASLADINGNFCLDPLFCDTANADYHISSASPCAPANNSSGVLIGALGIGCATEPIALIDPASMHVVQAHAIHPLTATICFGDFVDGHTAGDVSPDGLNINGVISPTAQTLLPSHPDFHGEVMEVTIPVRDFILGYGPLWDTTVQDYTVTGKFSDSAAFLVRGEVTMFGHRSGDLNLDGAVNVADLTYLVAYLFNGGPEPQVRETADLDHDGTVNVADLTELVRFLFG